MKCDLSIARCEVCQPRFYPHPTSEDCRRADITILGCEEFIAATKCGKCADGYVLSKYACIECQVTNCKDCSDDPTICKSCRNGFSSSVTAPLDCSLTCQTSNCASCAVGDNTKCIRCLPGFRLLPDDTCVACEDTKCLDCSGPDGTCVVSATGKTCTDNAFWNGTICADCATGCLRCDSNGVCIRCDSFNGIGMSNDGTCSSPIFDTTGMIGLGVLMIVIKLI